MVHRELGNLSATNDVSLWHHSPTRINSPIKLLDIPSSIPTPTVSSLVSIPRRTLRYNTPPAWLQDYRCNHSAHSTDPCSCSVFNLAHRSFLEIMTANQEPRSFAQAYQDVHWRKTMQDGVKHLLDSSVDRYKTHLVADGYSQVERVDYFDNFSPVAKTVAKNQATVSHSQKTNKDATVSYSSAEFEYRSMASTVYKLLWIGYLLQDFQISLSFLVSFWCDNKVAIHIAESPIFNEMTKHLDIDCHLVRKQFKKGFIAPKHISTKNQLADIFTKSLSIHVFATLLFKLGLHSVAPT
ncbi:UNVERIFIED_CONTAM: hypothetical protein Scaly_1482600 [Sesamum calycinum]|uniref:Uncharacterized protein n=1 Tax=Sesamum calycinum TaxID=2727403 RepID=A0AAW2PST9_9LAMI